MSSESDSRTGTVVAHHGVAVAVRFDDGEYGRLPLRRSNTVVVGDLIEAEGEVFRVLPSSGVLRRRDHHGRVRAVAAHLDLLGIVLAPAPVSPVGFVDRALVAARSAGVEPLVLINKCDLPGTEALLQELGERYQKASRVIAVSAHVRTGLDEIRSWLAPDRRGVFVGTSGVGKSSLLNALVPDLDLAIGEINETSGLGRHVTSVATLHRLSGGGELIDTPGFRDFGPVAVSPDELAAHFPGFEEALTRGCHFRDCLHLSEPGCAVSEALERGQVQAERHASYRSLLEELQQADADARKY